MNISQSIIATNAAITMPDGHIEVIADEALEKIADQVNKNGLPMLIDHDWLRPSGWAHCAWTERDGSNLRLVVESEIPENPGERAQLLDRFGKFLNRWAAERLSPHNDLLRSMAWPGAELTMDTDCVYLHAPGIADAMFPEVFSKIDDDGLLPLRHLRFAECGWPQCGRFMLVPSAHLRTGFGLPNAPNRLFMKCFVEQSHSCKNCEFRLAFDPNLLAIPDSFKPMEQRDYWWGPQYRGNPSKQQRGVTIHGPTNYDKLNGLIRTEFWWYHKEDRTFEVEELLERADLLSGGARPRGMRFVHSIFDLDKDEARHIDGAIRYYSDDLWQERIVPTSTINKFGKRAERIKVWRVDGNLPANMWYDLIHMFFRGNFTIAEYFGLPDPETFRSQLNRKRAG